MSDPVTAALISSGVGAGASLLQPKPKELPQDQGRKPVLVPPDLTPAIPQMPTREHPVTALYRMMAQLRAGGQQ